MGTLTIAGTIDVQQFWPSGKSDADTTKIIVDVSRGGVRYREARTARARRKSVYDTAFARVQGKMKPVIKNGKITVRLQGIDAPELHVRPKPQPSLGSLKGTGLSRDYRQHQAETATVRLGRFLATLGSGPVACRFTSELDHDEGPAAAIDSYGRFVGNILVGAADVNLWLLEHGLAIIALYNSMSRGELNDCVTAWNKGKSRGIARHHTKQIIRFDPSLLVRPKGSQPVDEGARKFILPKLFRRQCTWYAYRKAGLSSDDFQSFLQRSDEKDRVFELNDILTGGLNSARSRAFSRCVERGKKLLCKPEQIVFQEDQSLLYDQRGRPITSW